MRKTLIPLLVAALLLTLSGLALNLVSAAPTAQGTATRTPRTTATRTPRTTATRTPRTTATATVEATVSGTETVTDTPPLTDTDEVLTDTVPLTDTVVLTQTVIITQVLPITVSRPAENADANRTLMVMGQGRVSAAPDIASITLGVETLGEELTEATEENNATIQDILAVLEELGIPDRNVQTGSYTIYIERPSPGLPESSAATEPIYHVSQQITVRVQELDENLQLVSDLIGEAVEAGANTVYGPSFELGQDRAIQQRARRAAIEDAYLRAQDWAILTGVELVGVVSVAEMTPSFGPIATTQEEGLGGSGPGLQPGTLTYTQEVQVTFYIR